RGTAKPPSLATRTRLEFTPAPRMAAPFVALNFLALSFLAPIFLALTCLVLRWSRTRHPAAARRCRQAAPRARRGLRFQPKPAWVARELIRLKAHAPDLGCRSLAEVFNRRFAERGVSVGKSYVAHLLRQRRLDVLRLRRALKHRVPPPMPRNRTWALDLTG